MSGISSSIGPFSGINSGQLIEQLLALEARPVRIAQGRLSQLQLQQTAILDINSRLASLRDAAAAFRTAKTFNMTTATSSNDKVLTATSTTAAQPGTYQFIVDRLVTTQQMLSRGFADKSSTGLGASQFTFESSQARLDRDVALSDLNHGNGVSRGKIILTEGTKTATIDLSKAATVSEVLDAINGNGVVDVKASVQDGKLVLKHQTGLAFSVSNASGYTTAESLGIAGTSTGGGVLTGSTVYSLSGATTLGALNDGNGVAITSVAGTGAYNLSVKVTIAGNTTDVKVNLGEIFETVDNKQVVKETTVSTVAGVIKRMNDALDTAGFTQVRARISSDGSRLEMSDSSGTVTDIQFAENATLNDNTAAELGLMSGSYGAGVFTAAKVFAGLNTTLANRLNGGAGIAGDGVFNITARDGTSFTTTIDTDGTLTQIAEQLQTASGTGANGKPRISVSVNSKGTGLLVTDNTGLTTSNLIIQGTDGVDTADSLGISTGAIGVASATHQGDNLQHAYISRSTLLSSLNGGKGVGTGKFRLTDGFGVTAVVDIGEDTKNFGQLIDEINSQASAKNLKLKARINANGDGIVIEENVGTGPKGTLKLKITDETGTVAGGLKISGEATGLNADNKIDGSFERVVKFSASDTLEAISKKINEAGAGLTTSIIKDGSGAAPYRLSFAATTSGRAGRVLIDTNGFELSLNTMEKGDDSRVFFGSTDPAKAVLLSGASNTLDSVLPGVTIDLKSADPSPVALTIVSDSSGIEAKVNDFITTFNSLIERIDQQQSYNADTRAKGPLLGDGTTNSLRVAMFNTMQAPSHNITGRYRRLAEVGVEIGSGGKLTLDTEKFRAALAEDAKSVEALFTARVQDTTTTIDLGNGITATDPNAAASFSSLGVVGQLEELAKRYIDPSSGQWTAKKKATDTLIASQNKQITGMNDRLEARRGILQAQFQRMEKAIAQLQQQQSALSSLG
ncbi:MAG: flagellar filament capping protein FliD [Phycisphaerales bacterium]|nr:flagellar filament capping protein FliD [Phycisphaerales bacterium]